MSPEAFLMMLGLWVNQFVSDSKEVPPEIRFLGFLLGTNIFFAPITYHALKSVL